MNPIRILLAEDHNLVRRGIRLLLQTMDWVEVVGEAKNGEEVLAQSAELLPNIVLMNISTPVIGGLDAISKLKKSAASPKIIILSIQNSKEYIWQAIQAGASGYLVNDTEVEELRLAIRTVMRDQVYISPFILSTVVSDYLLRMQESPLREGLTTRQREILQMISMGSTSRDIAAKLGIASKTAEAHRAQLMQQLGIQNTAGLVRYAMRTGLVVADE